MLLMLGSGYSVMNFFSLDMLANFTEFIMFHVSWLGRDHLVQAGSWTIVLLFLKTRINKHKLVSCNSNIRGVLCPVADICFSS
jgi:hypothetical protein